MLHGWLDNCDSFQLLAPLLCDNRDIVAIDFSGHGLSDHRQGPYHNIDDAAELILAADAAFGAGTPFSLLGHSRGALIATVAAGTVPGRVERLILLEGMGMTT